MLGEHLTEARVTKKEVRSLKTGLTANEKKTLTFKQLRLERLEALQDGAPVSRAKLGAEWKGSGVQTTAPTLEHMATALNISPSTLRAYERGSNAPRWEIQEMVDFAKGIGLTVEELALVVRNTLASAVEGQQ